MARVYYVLGSSFKLFWFYLKQSLY